MGIAPSAVNVRRMSDLLIGTYTRDTASQGIYALGWDGEAGAFAAPVLAAPADNPSFLSCAGERVFVVNEVADFEGLLQGAVSVYRRRGGALSLEAVAPSGGADPCHVAVAGDRVAVANYSGGNVSLYRLAHGQLASAQRIEFSLTGPHRRQAQAHPHGVYFRGEVLWVPDLGGDRIYQVDVSSGAVVAALALAPGSGPRHLAFADPESDERCYVIHELSNELELIVAGRSRQRLSSLPEAATPSATAELALSVDGACLIGSNRGQDSLVSCAVDAHTGELSEPRFHDCGGAHPRHFALTRDGRWLLVANRDSDNVCALPLDACGRPGPVAAEVSCPAPVCVVEL